MDIFNSYLESKEALTEIQKSIFNLLEDNDTFNIMGMYDLKYLDFTECKQNDSQLIVNLYNYADSTPLVSFTEDRVILLSCDDTGIMGGYVSRSDREII